LRFFDCRGSSHIAKQWQLMATSADHSTVGKIHSGSECRNFLFFKSVVDIWTYR
jgi:hypothetical protein